MRKLQSTKTWRQPNVLSRPSSKLTIFALVGHVNSFPLFLLHNAAHFEITLTEDKPLRWKYLTFGVLLIIHKCYFCLTVKAKTAHEIVKNRPAAGVLDQALATEYKVGFLMSASPISVFTARIKASAVRRTIEWTRKNTTTQLLDLEVASIII